MAVSSDGRAFVRYDGDDEVSLPGYLNAIPSIVGNGDTFTLEAQFLELITAGGESVRFVEVDEPREVTPNAGLTKRELAAKLNADRDEADKVDPAAFTKDDLVAMADEYDRTHPEPPGVVAGNDLEETSS